MNANNRFWRIFPSVARDRRIASTTPIRSLRISVMSADSMAISDPAPMAKLTSDFGIAVSTVSDSAEFDKNLLTDLTNARESASGVSVDDELINLTAAQTAYNALTKVVTTTSAMLDTLMKLI